MATISQYIPPILIRRETTPEQDDPAKHYIASSYSTGLFLLIFAALALYALYFFLRWQRRRRTFGAVSSGGLWSALRGGDDPYSNVGYDPLLNQQFAFDEELGVELDSYNFGGEAIARHPIGVIKLRTGSAAAGWEKDVYGYGGAQPTAGATNVGTTTTKGTNIPAQVNTSIRSDPDPLGSAEDADELLRWAEANLPSPSTPHV